MFETYLIQPIYNVFIYLIGVMPHGDVGLAIIVLTLVVRAIFYPAFAANIRTQIGMQAVQGEMDEINETYKDNPTERSKRTMELLRKNKIRPFSSFLALIIQMPILIALYQAFFRQGLPKVATKLLYAFVPVPQEVTMVFLGVVNLGAAHNIILALIVAGLQYAVMWLSVSRVQSTTKTNPDRAAAQRTQQQLLLYFMPGLMGVLTYSFPAAAGLYFATSNLVSLGQEWLIRRKYKPVSLRS
jgi:YidC/Oxa1 family membrane protein insertase